MAHYTLDVHVDLRAVSGTLQRSLQRVIDLVSFGLQSAERRTRIKELTLPGTFLHIATSENTSLTVKEARTEFKKWVVAGGLRDSVEAVSGFLEEARLACAVWSFVGRKEILGEEWNRAIADERASFHGMGLPAKLDYFDRYDRSLVPEEEATCVLSINAARNCLVHRRGVVSERDLSSDEGLLVKWVRLELIADGPDGSRALTSGDIVQAGEAVKIRRSRQEKLFPLGASVEFTNQEFAEVCWTLMVFAQVMVANLERYGRSIGVPFDVAQDGSDEALTPE